MSCFPWVSLCGIRRSEAPPTVGIVEQTRAAASAGIEECQLLGDAGRALPNNDVYDSSTAPASASAIREAILTIREAAVSSREAHLSPLSGMMIPAPTIPIAPPAPTALNEDAVNTALKQVGVLLAGAAGAAGIARLYDLAQHGVLDFCSAHRACVCVCVCGQSTDQELMRAFRRGRYRGTVLRCVQ